MSTASSEAPSLPDLFQGFSGLSRHEFGFCHLTPEQSDNLTAPRKANPPPQTSHPKPRTEKAGAPRDLTSSGQLQGRLLPDARVGASHDDGLPRNGGLAGTGPARNVVSAGKKQRGHFGPCATSPYVPDCYDFGRMTPLRLCSPNGKTGRTSHNSAGASVVLQAKAQHNQVWGGPTRRQSLLCKDPLDGFPMAAVTSNHKLSPVKPRTGNQRVCRQESKTGLTGIWAGCLQGCAPSGGSRGEAGPVPFPAPIGAHTPWLTAPRPPSPKSAALCLQVTDSEGPL